MPRIGFDEFLTETYEAVGNRWRVVTPPPTFIETELDPPLPPTFAHEFNRAKYIFREDSFDSTARVRRGRFYVRAKDPQPSPQLVLSRFTDDYASLPHSMPLFVFDPFLPSLINHAPKLVALGASESLWSVVSRAERMSSGEYLFTLKARHAFGILPELASEEIPKIGREKVVETLETLTDAAYRESPGSVIDRARDAAQFSLATWAAAQFSDETLLTQDLGFVIKKIDPDGNKKMVALNAAIIVQRLHSRGKPNEQERFGFRVPMEGDAELALNAVAFLIRELKWAR